MRCRAWTEYPCPRRRLRTLFQNQFPDIFLAGSQDGGAVGEIAQRDVGVHIRYSNVVEVNPTTFDEASGLSVGCRQSRGGEQFNYPDAGFGIGPLDGVPRECAGIVFTTNCDFRDLRGRCDFPIRVGGAEFRHSGQKGVLRLGVAVR